MLLNLQRSQQKCLPDLCLTIWTERDDSFLRSLPQTGQDRGEFCRSVSLPAHCRTCFKKAFSVVQEYGQDSQRYSSLEYLPEGKKWFCMSIFLWRKRLNLTEQSFSLVFIWWDNSDNVNERLAWDPSITSQIKLKILITSQLFILVLNKSFQLKF